MLIKKEESDSGSGSDDSEVFEVERVLKMRRRGKKREFYVRWKGYESNEDTWEPEAGLEGARAKVDEYLENNPDETPAKKGQKRPAKKSSTPKSKSRSQKRAEESGSEDAVKESEGGESDEEDEFEPSGSKKAKKSGKGKTGGSSKPKPKQNGNSSVKSPLATLVANRMKNNSNMRWINDSDSDDSNNDSGLARPNSREKTDESQPNGENNVTLNETTETEPTSEFRVRSPSETPTSEPRAAARQASVPSSNPMDPANKLPMPRPPLKIKIAAPNRQPIANGGKVNGNHEKKAEEKVEDAESVDDEPRRSSKSRGAKEKANLLLSNGHASTSAASASNDNVISSITFTGAYRDSVLGTTMFVGVDKKQKRKVFSLKEAHEKYGLEFCSFLGSNVAFAENGDMAVRLRQISESNE